MGAADVDVEVGEGKGGGIKCRKGFCVRFNTLLLCPPLCSTTLFPLMKEIFSWLLNSAFPLSLRSENSS